MTNEQVVSDIDRMDAALELVRLGGEELTPETRRKLMKLGRDCLQYAEAASSSFPGQGSGVTLVGDIKVHALEPDLLDQLKEIENGDSSG